MNTKTGKIGIRLGAVLLSLCLLVGLLPITVFASEKRDTYHVYSDDAIVGDADSQVYAVTIENVNGKDLHYVYSPNAIHSNELMEKLREGLSESYKSLVPTFEEEYSNIGFLRFSRDQAKYEEMKLNWDDPKAVADALISGSGSVSVVPNDAAISVTDISELHSDENVVSDEEFFEGSDHYTSPPEFSQLASGKNRVEAMVGVTYRTETVEDKAYYDVFNSMHVTQIYSYTATKAASVSDPIDLPVTPNRPSFTIVQRPAVEYWASPESFNPTEEWAEPTTPSTDSDKTNPSMGGDDQTGGSDQTGSDTTPQEPGKNEGAVTNPQTGDSSNAVLWIALLFASGVGLMGAAVYSRKKDTVNNQ